MMSRNPYSVSARGQVYTLRSKEVKLTGGKRQTMYFFTREGGPPLDALEVIENPRMSLPLEWQIHVAQLLVRLQSLTPEEAASAAGRLKGEVEGLSSTQTDDVVEQILQALQEE
jgi:hypothetical protein